MCCLRLKKGSKWGNTSTRAACSGQTSYVIGRLGLWCKEHGGRRSPSPLRRCKFKSCRVHQVLASAADARKSGARFRRWQRNIYRRTKQSEGSCSGFLRGTWGALWFVVCVLWFEIFPFSVQLTGAGGCLRFDASYFFFPILREISSTILGRRSARTLSTMPAMSSDSDSDAVCAPSGAFSAPAATAIAASS
jgi:hypothetical protein